MSGRALGPVWIGICLLQQIALAQSSDAPAAACERLFNELRSLRIEMFESRLERQAERVRSLESGLDDLRILRIKLNAEAQYQQEDFRHLREELQSSEFNAAERAQIESSKAEVIAEAGARIRRETLAVEQRESVAHEELNREKEQLRKLSESLALLRRPR